MICVVCGCVVVKGGNLFGVRGLFFFGFALIAAGKIVDLISESQQTNSTSFVGLWAERERLEKPMQW